MVFHIGNKLYQNSLKLGREISLNYPTLKESWGLGLGLGLRVKGLSGSYMV